MSSATIRFVKEELAVGAGILFGAVALIGPILVLVFSRGDRWAVAIMSSLVFGSISVSGLVSSVTKYRAMRQIFVANADRVPLFPSGEIYIPPWSVSLLFSGSPETVERELVHRLVELVSTRKQGDHLVLIQQSAGARRALELVVEFSSLDVERTLVEARVSDGSIRLARYGALQLLFEVVDLFEQAGGRPVSYSVLESRSPHLLQGDL